MNSINNISAKGNPASGAPAYNKPQPVTKPKAKKQAEVQDASK